MKTVGNTLLLVTVLLALAPVMIVGRVSQTSTQIYQDAKGSWMPAAYAYANPRAFFIVSGFTGLAGARFIVASSRVERRRRARRP
jgi:Na+-driven multidrug efflux pump